MMIVVVVVVIVRKMIVNLAIVATTCLFASTSASLRSERQADLIRHQLLKDLGMEAAPDTAKVITEYMKNRFKNYF